MLCCCQCGDCSSALQLLPPTFCWLSVTRLWISQSAFLIHTQQQVKYRLWLLLLNWPHLNTWKVNFQHNRNVTEGWRQSWDWDTLQMIHNSICKEIFPLIWFCCIDRDRDIDMNSRTQWEYANCFEKGQLGIEPATSDFLAVVSPQSS